MLSLLTFICSCIDTWQAARWAQFQSAFAVISTSVYLVLYLLNLISRLPGPWPLIVGINTVKYVCAYCLFIIVIVIVIIQLCNYLVASCVELLSSFS